MENELAIQVSPWVAFIGPAVPFLVEWVKDSDLFPNITPEMKNKVLALFALLSAIGGTGAAAMNGQLNEGALQAFSATATNFLTVMGVGELVYRHVLKRFQNGPPTPPAGGANA